MNDLVKKVLYVMCMIALIQTSSGMNRDSKYNGCTGKYTMLLTNDAGNEGLDVDPKENGLPKRSFCGHTYTPPNDVGNGGMYTDPDFEDFVSPFTNANSEQNHENVSETVDARNLERLCDHDVVIDEPQVTYRRIELLNFKEEGDTYSVDIGDTGVSIAKKDQILTITKEGQTIYQGATIQLPDGQTINTATPPEKAAVAVGISLKL